VTRPPLWRLAPWTRAPLLGLRQPAAVLAVLVTAAILACAVASAPLFLSSARSAALQLQLADQCAEAGWVQAGAAVDQYDQNGEPTGGRADPAVSDALAAAWAEQGRRSTPVLATALLVGRDRFALGAGVSTASGEPASLPVALYYRPDALAHVEVVAQRSGDGVWLPESYAQGAGIALGDRITVAGTPVGVVGLYRDLAAVDAGPYWCDYRLYYANDISANTPPPAFALATDPATF
jgi:putative ABC transport system permease protein